MTAVPQPSCFCLATMGAGRDVPVELDELAVDGEGGADLGGADAAKLTQSGEQHGVAGCVGQFDARHCFDALRRMALHTGRSIYISKYA